eukprot:RCo011878
MRQKKDPEWNVIGTSGKKKSGGGKTESAAKTQSSISAPVVMVKKSGTAQSSSERGHGPKVSPTEESLSTDDLIGTLTSRPSSAHPPASTSALSPFSANYVQEYPSLGSSAPSHHVRGSQNGSGQAHHSKSSSSKAASSTPSPAPPPAA